MMYLKLFLIFFLFFTGSVKANEVEIIEIHKNKSLDQLVLESSTTSESNELNDVYISEESSDDTSSDIENSTAEDSNNENNDLENDDIKLENSEVVDILKSENLFDINEKIINTHFASISNIKSRTLNREFIKILSNPQLDSENITNDKIYFIIKKLYEIGEIGNAYKLIKNIDSSSITNKEHLAYFKLIELNYLFSTFKLTEVCELKTLLLDQSIMLPKYLLEKTDIFCLTLENKFAEAKLLNSLLLENESDIDKNFQDLFNYMIIENNTEAFKALSSINSKELVFLYSAMLRINELPLYEDFISIDPLNLTIPVILSESTQINIRIKAANKAFIDEVISIDSLSALYQSVDFNSKDFNKPDQTISSLNNDELIMAFYYQLANIQIFPDERLNVILDYWKFAKNSGLEFIAYAITKNIIETFTPTIENSKYGMEIAIAHISNKNYVEASKWIDLSESSNTSKDQIDYARFLIALNDTDDLTNIINYLSNNGQKINSINNQNTLETMQILKNFLNIKEESNLTVSYDNITDNRLMPSYFLINDIKNNMKEQNDLSLFLLGLISMNNKNWQELHPEHLTLVLNSYNNYDQGLLIKPIILEILSAIEIF